MLSFFDAVASVAALVWALAVGACIFLAIDWDGLFEAKSRTRETAISLPALQWVGESKPVSSITMMASVFPRANLPKMFLNCA